MIGDNQCMDEGPTGLVMSLTSSIYIHVLAFGLKRLINASNLQISNNSFCFSDYK